jgi:hypothetical protein
MSEHKLKPGAHSHLAHFPSFGAFIPTASGCCTCEQERKLEPAAHAHLHGYLPAPVIFIPKCASGSCTDEQKHKLYSAAHAHLRDHSFSWSIIPTNVLQGAALLSITASCCNLLRMRTCRATPYPSEFIPTNVLEGAALMSVTASCCNLLRMRSSEGTPYPGEFILCFSQGAALMSVPPTVITFCACAPGVFIPTNVLQGAAPKSITASCCNLLRMRTCGATPYPGEFIPTIMFFRVWR